VSAHEESRSLIVRLDARTLDRLRELAQAERITLGDLIRRMLSEAAGSTRT
jgi:hypothetical protein